MSELSQTCEDIARIAKSMFDRGLTPGSTGNLSVKLSDGSFLITPSGSSMGSLEPSKISHLSPTLELLDGDPPTKEIPLHMAFYETRPSAKAVVHLHSTYATLLSMLPDIDPENVLPPMTPYAIMLLGKVKLLPFFLPGDNGMGQSVRDLNGEHAAVILANHGPVVSGRSLQKAAYAYEELEETAKLAVLARGLNPRLLTQRQVELIERKYPVDK